MVFARPLVESAGCTMKPMVDPLELSRTHRILLDVLRAVRNVRDEDDVQCLVFLAGEFGILKPNPFCFSHRITKDDPAPRSVILRDMVRELVASGLVEQAGSVLRVCPDLLSLPLSEVALCAPFSQITALSPMERQALAQATIDLHRSGISLFSPESELAFRHAVFRVLGAIEGADLAARHLTAVRHQLSLA